MSQFDSAPQESSPKKVRRWYDTDPILLEVLNFMELAPEQAKGYAQNLIKGVEKNVSPEELEIFYQKYNDPERPKNRWYDEHPELSKAIAFLKVMPQETQRLAALQFIDSIQSDSATYAILKESFAMADLDLSYLDEDCEDEAFYAPFDVMDEATEEADFKASKELSQGVQNHRQTPAERKSTEASSPRQGKP